MAPQCPEGAFFIGLHEAGVTYHIGYQYGRQTPLSRLAVRRIGFFPLFIGKRLKRNNFFFLAQRLYPCPAQRQYIQ